LVEPAGLFEQYTLHAAGDQPIRHWRELVDIHRDDGGRAWLQSYRLQNLADGIGIPGHFFFRPLDHDRKSDGAIKQIGALVPGCRPILAIAWNVLEDMAPLAGKVPVDGIGDILGAQSGGGEFRVID